MSAERIARREDPPRGAEIVIEVLSQGRSSRDRDLVNKRSDDARAQIPEYWIVDPEQSRITVLSFSGDEYLVAGEFSAGSTAASAYLPEFLVNVTNLFASAKADL